MPTRPHVYQPVSITGLGWAFSAVLVALFVICLFAALLFPMRAAHGWVALVSTAPIDSARIWVEGIVYSIVAGWVAAIIVALVYNRVAVR
jgi:hypothetical protein